MKRFKAFIVCTAAIFIAAVSCFAGCGDPEAGTIHITVKTPAAISMNSIAHEDVKTSKEFLTRAASAFEMQYGEKVKFNIVEFKSGQQEAAITNTMGTENAADILFDNFFNMGSFIHTGYAVPLGDLLTPALEEDLNKRYVDFGKFGGTLYMMPYLASQNILIYNKELLRKCGLEQYVGEAGKIQTDWTMDDWSYILQTLSEKLPDGSYPMMMYSKDNDGDTHIMTMLRAFGGKFYDSDDLTTNFNFDIENENVIKALKWIQDGVEKDWFINNPQTKTLANNEDLFRIDKLAFCNFNLGSPLYTAAAAEGGIDKYGFVNYPGDIATFFCTGFGVFDNGDENKIRVAKDFIKFIYDNSEWLEYSAGSIPVSHKVIMKYQESIFMLAEFHRNSENGHEVNFSRNLPNWQGRPDSVRSVFYKEMTLLLTQKRTGGFATTPEDCAKNLQKVLTQAITYGREHSSPHK